MSETTSMTSPNAFYEKIWLKETETGFEQRDTFSFLNMTGEKYKVANSSPSIEARSAAAYWQLREGMNISGICNNVECSVLGRHVTLNMEGGGLGFGNFDRRKDMPSRFLCPECMKACNIKVVSCSFYKCRWSYEGVALEWDGIDDVGFASVKKSGGGLANMTNGHLYCDTADSLTKLSQLKIVVENIQDTELVKRYSSLSEDSELKSSSKHGEED